MLATAVIVISLIVQGLTLEPLVRLAGIARPGDAEHEDWHPAPRTWHPDEVRFADEDESRSR